ncbi:MAG: DUF1028 domain-containing protein [bacterium]
MGLKPSRTFILGLFGLLCLNSPALATWSIVVLNHLTGEVCVATATCIPNINIRKYVPVIRVGKGAGAAQSMIDSSAYNRNIMWSAFSLDAPPDRILERLTSVGSSPQERQYGIVGFSGDARTFSGYFNGAHAIGVTGQVGELSYAIQGNVLVGALPVLEAELALLNSPGDLSQRVMAAMQAARYAGGDGRCSCSPTQPTSCGAPPPSFVHSAHAATIVIARMGDIDGVCNVSLGCANGTYYLRRNFSGGVSDVDAVEGLQANYDIWRAVNAGRPDGITSVVQVPDQELPADGQSVTHVVVQLVDLEGVPLTAGGATVTVETRHTGPDPALAGAVSDHGNGSYSFDLTATMIPGEGEWGLRVDDGIKPVLLWPPVTLSTVATPELHCSRSTINASQGGTATLRVQRPLVDANRAYQILGSVAGTQPGTMVGGVLVPLNNDRLFGLTLAGGLLPPVFQGFEGNLDGAGRSLGRFAMDSSWAWVFVGQSFDFCVLLADMGQGGEVLGPVGFSVEP